MFHLDAYFQLATVPVDLHRCDDHSDINSYGVVEPIQESHKRDLKNNPDEEFTAVVTDIFNSDMGIVPWLPDDETIDDSKITSVELNPPWSETTVNTPNQPLIANNVLESEMASSMCKNMYTRTMSSQARASDRDQKELQYIKRMALFKRKFDSSVLDMARFAALEKTKLDADYDCMASWCNSQNAGKQFKVTATNNMNNKMNSKNKSDGEKTEAERLKEERYQKKLASNRLTAKRARLRRENYIYELEKQLETLEQEIQRLSNHAQALSAEAM